jgi:hypothetical protein
MGPKIPLDDVVTILEPKEEPSPESILQAQQAAEAAAAAAAQAAALQQQLLAQQQAAPTAQVDPSMQAGF